MEITRVYDIFDPAELSPYIGTRKLILDEALEAAYGFVFHGTIPDEIGDQAKRLLIRCINRSLAGLDVLISYRIKKNYNKKTKIDPMMGRFLAMGLLTDSSWRTLARDMRLGEATEDEVAKSIKEDVPIILDEMKKELMEL